MSGTTENLSKKIAGANDLQGVVRSMKALAASSIGQYEKAVQSLDSYYRTVELAIAACLRLAPPAPVVKGRSARSAAVGAVLFGSDQGLVGRFNEVLVECASHQLKALPGKTAKIWAIGDRVQALVADSGLALSSSFLSVPTSVDAITSFVGQILSEIEQAREQGDVTEVYVFHNHPTTGTFYEPVGKKLLPLDLAWQNKIAALPWPTKSVPEVMGGIIPALAAFIRGYLFVLLFQACAESLASENASRLAAMQRAEKNIEDILDDLNRAFHRIRQETIDEELFDVISGFDALTPRRV